MNLILADRKLAVINNLYKLIWGMLKREIQLDRTTISNKNECVKLKRKMFFAKIHKTKSIFYFFFLVLLISCGNALSYDKEMITETLPVIQPNK